MQTSNPYETPGAAVRDMGEQVYQPVKVFSASGRIGRVRYIAYSIGWALLVGVAIAALGGASGAAGLRGLAAVIIVAGYVALFVGQFLFTIQRCHDFDVSGWLSLIMLIPFVNLIFWFIPGTAGENRYGDPPPPNTTGVIVLALILPVLFAVGIVAGIGMGAYQAYTRHAGSPTSSQ